MTETKTDSEGNKPDMRRAERAMTNRAEILQILSNVPVMNLAMCTQGAPYVVPLHFAFEDTLGGLFVYVHGALSGKKIDILSENPRVSFAVSRVDAAKGGIDPCAWTAGYESVIGFGTAQMLTDRSQKSHALTLLMRKNGYPGEPVYPAAALDKTAVIRITVTEITGKRNRL